MIVATIIEYTPQSSGSPTSVNREINGCSSTVFYTQSDAIVFARLMSELIVYGAGSSSLYGLVMVLNTDTEERRWWFGGTEFTG